MRDVCVGRLRIRRKGQKEFKSGMGGKGWRLRVKAGSGGCLGLDDQDLGIGRRGRRLGVETWGEVGVWSLGGS